MFSPEFCEIFKNIFFYKTPAVAAPKFNKNTYFEKHLRMDASVHILLLPSQSMPSLNVLMKVAYQSYFSDKPNNIFRTLSNIYDGIFRENTKSP